MTAALPTRTDVLVVGAGPAGLTLTTALALAGVDHVALEPKEAVAPGAKAAGVQPRTLEYLDRLGVGATLVGRGLPGAGFALREGDEELLRVSYASLDSPHPHLLLVGQDVTEQVLADRLGAVGGRLFRGYRLLSWQRTHPGVLATVAGPDGLVRTVQARFLVGADGLHSPVREGAGIAFRGDSPATLFALADVHLDLAGPPDTDTAFFLAPDGIALVSPMPDGMHRVVTSVPPGTPPPSAADVEHALATRTGGALRTARVRDVAASTTYRFQQRVASRLVDGPVALLGDAAHTHSPAGGQGMNTGIQDAADLAWRLAEIVRHGAPESLLAGYDDERRPVAEELIAFTGQLTALTTLTDPRLGTLRNTVLAAVRDVPAVTDFLAGRLSQLDIGYGADDRTGRRLPPSRFATPVDAPVWVLADPGATAVHGDRPRVVPAPELTASALVRPDGIIDAVGLTADAARERLA
ncbi:FAD-dependent monooxygenase [Actinomycetospora sp. NBRC 106378]|uniref:FAD-dependent monooxygenase n=1 Tax=Actinomycetospora sp. NBRC 106378 TaxID=3032208 RepID=UPI0024A3E30E|nr:FAD-dependent monooxygenase [Actinomycetospora sp. NBRC 106378]GLZ55468.1 pentachlorophenol monooxygenase [Actinomycetospora sp. NBRC 106378]